MGDAWGPGARSALPMVGELFQQSLRGKWIDAKVEFDIPRPRPQPPPEAQPQVPQPLQGLANFFGRLFRRQ
ncbi:MAG: hypothetical protein ABIT82_10005, partial [Ramlibacter sp.]